MKWLKQLCIYQKKFGTGLNSTKISLKVVFYFERHFVHSPCDRRTIPRAGTCRCGRCKRPHTTSPGGPHGPGPCWGRTTVLGQTPRVRRLRTGGHGGCAQDPDSLKTLCCFLIKLSIWESLCAKPWWGVTHTHVHNLKYYFIHSYIMCTQYTHRLYAHNTHLYCKQS